MATRKTTRKTVKKAAKKAVKKTARKVAAKRTRAPKDSPYLSIKTGKPVTENYALRNPLKVMAREVPAEVSFAPADESVETMNLGTVTLEGAYNPYDVPLDIHTAFHTGAEDNIFWAVLRKGMFGSSKIVQLFTTRDRAEMEARQLDQESGLSFNKYTVQRAELNLDYQSDESI